MDSEQEGGSDDNEEEWTYSESRNKGGARKQKKEKSATSSPYKSGRGPGRPPKQHKEKGHGGGEAGGSNLADFHSLKVCIGMYCTVVHEQRQRPLEASGIGQLTKDLV